MRGPDRWTLHRPAWAVAVAVGVYASAILCVAYVLGAVYPTPIVVLIVVLLSLWAQYRGRRASRWQHGFLELDSSSQWRHISSARVRPLSLSHVWHSHAWTTLRFVDLSATHEKERMLELTVWKTCVGASLWRQLQISVAADRAGRLKAVASP